MKGLFAVLLLLIAGAPGADDVVTRFNAPEGYHQCAVQPGSFAEYLQDLPLKPVGAHTLTYKGGTAATDPFTAAVVDMSVGKEDLHAHALRPQ